MSRKRSCERIASATAATSLVVWGELINQLRHADPALDGRIVFERELRCPLQPQLAGQPALQDAVRRLQAGQALSLLLLGAEDADEDPRVPQIRRRLDSRHGDEPDPRVFELTDRLRQHLADGFVDASHPVAHHWYSTRVALHALALAAVAAWCFVTALAGGLVGLVLGNIRLPALLLISSSAGAAALRRRGTGASGRHQPARRRLRRRGRSRRARSGRDRLARVRDRGGRVGPRSTPRRSSDRPARRARAPAGDRDRAVVRRSDHAPAGRRLALWSSRG